MSGRFSHERMFDREDRRHVAELWSETAAGGMVVTAHYLATAAGVYALERGGNAIDAAVAASLALGVCEPAGSGLGGMAAALVHLARPRRTFGVDGACVAPERATPAEVARSKRYRGYRAVAVPRYLAVLRHLLARYGTLGRDDLLAPAIAIAEEGFPQTRTQHEVAAYYRRALARSTAAAFFLGADGDPRPPGADVRQPELARTLCRLRDAGLEDFYTGQIGAEIASDIERQDGFVSRLDLERALPVSETAPLRGRFDGEDVVTLGPPFGGLTLLQMLHMASSLPRADLDLDVPGGVVRVAALIRRARQDRRTYRLRTRADAPGEAVALLDPSYAGRAAREALASLPPTPAIGVAPGRGRPGTGETSHVVVFDRAGNAVSLTQSIERSFGAAVATPGLGFLYNGYLRAFKVANRAHPHFIEPGAPARSNAAPTLVLDAEGARTAIGSTGSERMCSGIFEVLLRLRKDRAFEAVHAPRLHCTPESRVLWEEPRFPPGCREALVESGFTLEPLPPYSFKVGGLQLALRAAGGGFCGVSEPRRDGAAAGPLASGD